MKDLWNLMKKGVRRLRKIFTRRKIQQAVAFAGTLGVSSYILWYLLPTWLAVFIIATVTLHEFGHFFTGKLKGFKVKLPLFFPGIYLMMGVTQFDDGRGSKDPTVILMGPMVGMAVAVTLALGCYLVGFMPGFYASGWLFIFQLYSGTFGSDGKAYRRARNATVPTYWATAPRALEVEV